MCSYYRYRFWLNLAENNPAVIIPDCLILLFGIYWHYLVLSRNKEGSRKLPKAMTMGQVATNSSHPGKNQDDQSVSQSVDDVDPTDTDHENAETTESSPSANPRPSDQVDTNGANVEQEFDFINAPSQALPWKLFLKRAWFLWSTRVMLCLIVLFACTSTSPDLFSAMYVAITSL